MGKYKIKIYFTAKMDLKDVREEKHRTKWGCNKLENKFVTAP